MIEKILEDHALWFDSQGDRGERAILRGVDLSHAVLKKVTLVEADLMAPSSPALSSLNTVPDTTSRPPRRC